MVQKNIRNWLEFFGSDVWLWEAFECVDGRFSVTEEESSWFVTNLRKPSCGCRLNEALRLSQRWSELRLAISYQDQEITRMLSHVILNVLATCVSTRADVLQIIFTILPPQNFYQVSLTIILLFREPILHEITSLCRTCHWEVSLSSYLVLVRKMFQVLEIWYNMHGQVLYILN
jgi:hypothetical protein